jgi:hypothetical protein
MGIAACIRAEQGKARNAEVAFQVRYGLAEEVFDFSTCFH